MAGGKKCSNTVNREIILAHAQIDKIVAGLALNCTAIAKIMSFLDIDHTIFLYVLYCQTHNPGLFI